MANLFWKTPKGVKALLATSFRTEEEFEATVFKTPGILEDIVLLKRQIRGGNKSGIPDIIGIDSEGKACIIEMKNTPVDSGIIPQVLRYAFWAERNPDSIKSLWLECENRPDDIAISWDKLEVRILIIAPVILRSTLDLVDKINYDVDLIEVTRWVEGHDELLLVNTLELEPTKSPGGVHGRPLYDEAFYKSQRNHKTVEEFLKYCRELTAFVNKKGWNLQPKFTSYGCGFKAGFFNAFGIQWVGIKTFAFSMNLSEKDARQFKIPMTRYQKWGKEGTAHYFIEPGKTKVADFGPLFEAAYKKLSGD